ncbi:Protein of unknown function (DUF3558) [Streptoalloteichus tenebrarius]|uniref:DUF3558 domain-containing protein n=1 Tax=Streptoalloteichus tenebrarius (strain ATCC 17920 / DSM 40477 / JCM 4838 / CBS 697.72 / NBRC 16177 / NCIMB 11028 / NRRL B-12390 / A12253. 1 / ISP 5477) TaxID=1933 RepID=A0ABT1HU80_STRSD|nr:DUF3558 domain-containing protein [Streptoalloteichus tenebrarius]MCP2259083.1 Protein of unknown function (DUF3558) [Streptoalloteichus tenebrarius]BFE99591.1 hypothetical protein GCM10020241_12670 [Streptoalloteichus tenebrarius]
MSDPRARAALAGLVGVTVLFLAACGGGSIPGQATTPEGSASASDTSPRGGIDKVDPCKLLSASQLSTFGLQTTGKPDKLVSEPYCEYDGDPFSIRVITSPNRNLEKFKSAGQTYDRFEPNQVNGRPGAKIIVAGDTGHGGCVQLMDAGQGSARIQVNYKFGKYEGKDPCADAMAIAKLVEPNLPK